MAKRYWHTQCRGKQPHRTREQALQVRAVMAEEKPELLIRLTAYHCPWCDMWHLGNRDRADRADRAVERQRRKALRKATGA